MADLVPYPFGRLVSRMLLELDRGDSIFGLPRRRFFTGSDRLDFSVKLHGRKAATPLGPAAGPHTQMAQNIVLGWLGGARIFELKTVQVRDDLTIPRPCIDMRTVGYNAEWSQELTIDESLAEYVKASMLITILRHSDALQLSDEATPTIFDMSIGYGLVGIQSEKVVRFLDGMRNATALIDVLRREIPDAHAHLRDLDFEACISDSVTLSTFHGCPPDEIERIALFLIRERGLNCVVKFNPTLLGSGIVHRLLHDVLGYEHIRVPASAFDNDTTWPQAVEIVERVSRAAAECGAGFGVKLTNTLVVENTTRYLPESQSVVYLSGAPLHVIATHLLGRFRVQFGDRIPVSFSAGVDAKNYPSTVALGLAPVTVCTDLLRPGGYGRLAAYHQRLGEAMAACGAVSIDEYVIRGLGNGESALDRAEPDFRTRRFSASQAALRRGAALIDSAGSELYARWLSEAVVLNTESYVREVTRDPRYAAAHNASAPARVDRSLQLFDCITCDKCIPVCPNNANFAFATAQARIPTITLSGTPAAPLFERGEDVVLDRPHQIATFADFCNRCGNCDVFCPEEGGPYLIKPLFFGSAEQWRGAAEDGFYVTPSSVFGRIDGCTYYLDVDGTRRRFSGAGFAIDLELEEPEKTVGGRWSGTVPLTWCFVMDLLRRSLLDPGQLNYVNVAWSGSSPALKPEPLEDAPPEPI